MKWVILFTCAMAQLYGASISTIAKSQGVLTKEDLLHFKELFRIESFLETGTYAGDTTAVAAEVFPQVFSVEIYRPLYEKARNRFKTTPNVHLYFGDTCDRLSDMIGDSSPQRLYWLDAHSSGGGTGGIPGFSPILSELTQIYASGDLNAVILLDDLRGMCHCDQRTNLPLREILAFINQVHSGLRFYSIGDIGIIYNADVLPDLTFSPLVHAASKSRFFDAGAEDEEILSQLIHAELYIGQMGHLTREEKNFHQQMNFVNREMLGGEVIYLLWQALYELEHGDWNGAIRDFQLISDSFYAHWRIDAYLVKANIKSGHFDKALELFQDRLLIINRDHPKILKQILGDAYDQFNLITQ